MFHPGVGQSYLDVLYTDGAWCLYEPSKGVCEPVEVKGIETRNFWAYWPEETVLNTLHAAMRGRKPKKEVPASVWEATELCNQALEPKKQKDWPTAIRLLKEAIEKAPLMTRAHNLLAMVYREDNQLELAIEHFYSAWTGVIEHEISSVEVKIMQGVPLAQDLTGVLIDSGRADEAVTVAERTLAVSPHEANLLYNLACAHAQLRDVSETVAALERATAIDPQQAVDASSDSDFEPIRHEPSFVRFLEMSQQGKETERIADDPEGSEVELEGGTVTFGVDADGLNAEKVLAAIGTALGKLGPHGTDIFATLSRQNDVEKGRSYWFQLRSTAAQNLQRSRLCPQLCDVFGREVSAVISSERSQECGFERWSSSGCVFALVSRGPFLVGDVEQIDVSYPQRGYAPKTLTALADKDDDLLTDQERAALDDYKGANSIGWAQFHPLLSPLLAMGVKHNSERFVVASKASAVGTEVNDGQTRTLVDATRATLDLSQLPETPSSFQRRSERRKTQAFAEDRAAREQAIDATAKLSMAAYGLVLALTALLSIPLILVGPIAVVGVAITGAIVFLALRGVLVKRIDHEAVTRFGFLSPQVYPWSEFTGEHTLERYLNSEYGPRFETRTTLEFERGKAVVSTLLHANADALHTALFRAYKLNRRTGQQ